MASNPSFDFSNLKSFCIPSEVENIILRNNIHLNPKEVIIKYTSNPLLNFLVIFDKVNENLFIYAGSLKNISDLLKPQEQIEYIFDEDTFEVKPVSKGKNPKILEIDVTDNKEYCAELILLKDYTLKINFITTNEKIGCRFDDKGCKALNFLFKEIFSFLNEIKFNGTLILDDDSQVDGESLLTYNLVNGKESIYCKYGFKYKTEDWENKIAPFLYLIQDFQDKISFKGISDKNYKLFLSNLKKTSGFDFNNLRLIKMVNNDYLSNFKEGCNFKARCDDEKENKLYYAFDNSLPLSQEEYEDDIDIYLSNVDKIKDMSYLDIQSYEDIIFPENNFLIEKIKENKEALKLIIELTINILKENGYHLFYNPLRLEKVKEINVDKDFITSLSKFLFSLDLMPLVNLICKNLLI